jgi:hypothetical protein
VDGTNEAPEDEIYPAHTAASPWEKIERRRCQIIPAVWDLPSALRAQATGAPSLLLSGPGVSAPFGSGQGSAQSRGTRGCGETHSPSDDGADHH